MAIIKCKMCGGDLEVTAGQSVARCEYCDSTQTIPTADNEKKIKLFFRAGRLLNKKEFDKAAGIFESILTEFPEEAEAYWGLILCRYGIEYVDDPATGNKIPTCHRSSYDSLLADENYKKAVEKADVVARNLYIQEGQTIEALRKQVLEVSGKEKPYDIFICFKDTAADGGRTKESVVAERFYDMLVEKGYRVFFSRVTLRDKVGVAYEPYIFAALNSAKLMLAFGSSYENYQAIWVRNEWSRYLKLMAKDPAKRLFPCFLDMDPSELPEEFSGLQGKDFGQYGADVTLLRAITNALPPTNAQPKASEAAPVIQQVVQSNGPNIQAMLKRGYMELEDGAYHAAKDRFDQALNIEPENSMAYLGLLCAELNLSSLDQIGNLGDLEYSKNTHYIRADRFANEELKQQLAAWYQANEEVIRRREEEAARAAAEEQRRAQEQARREEEERLAREAQIREHQNYLASLRKRHELFSGGMTANFYVKKYGPIRLTVRADGTVRVEEVKNRYMREVSQWRDIVSVASGYDHVVGLKRDGTVITAGKDTYGCCKDTRSWRNIVKIYAEGYETFGITSDGRVLLGGAGIANGAINATDAVAIASGDGRYYVLSSQGTIKEYGEKKFSHLFSDEDTVVAIAATVDYLALLYINGRVNVMAKKSILDSVNLRSSGDWEDIIAIRTWCTELIGLRADGTLVSTKPDSKFSANNAIAPRIISLYNTDKYDCAMGLRGDGYACYCDSGRLVGDGPVFTDLERTVAQREQIMKELYARR